MPYLTNNTHKQDIGLFYQDYGEGQPVILIHGWPLSHRAWENQINDIVDASYRCIAYDRRGFGISDFPLNGYDYSTLASDLKAIIDELDLNNCILVGFSMGGGEVVRYFTEYGNDKIERAALISSIIPLVKHKEDNPNGVPVENINGILDAVRNDRLSFLKDFHKNFYNYDQLKDRVSQEQLDYDWVISSHASPRGTLKAAEAWAHTDFRDELKNVNVPTLIVHGTEDNIVPMETSAVQAAKGISNNTFHKIKNAPHGLNVTHKKELNKLLIDFFNESTVRQNNLKREVEYA